MANILCTSIIGDTFGPVISDQLNNQTILLGCITQLLDTAERDDSCTALELLALHGDIVEFLGCVVGTDAGMRLVATHPLAVERLAVRVAVEVDQLYEWRRGEGERVAFLNRAVRLLCAIVKMHPEDACVGLARLERFVVGMGRLAYSEVVAQEGGLDGEVVDAAAAVLERMMPSDEEDPLAGMFFFEESAEEMVLG